MIDTSPAKRGTPQALIVGLTLVLSGCGSGQYPVRGTVTLADGAPLTKGLIIFERVEGGAPITARGTIGPDGRYELSTQKPGDGVPLGRYKVVINPLDASDAPDEAKKLPFDLKYINIKSSDLEFEVKAEPNEIAIKLGPPPRKAGPKPRSPS